MAETSQHWNLFGYDLRTAYRYWRAGWKELFWGDRSWLRRSLGETVQALFPESGSEQYYHADRQVKKRSSKAIACIIPNKLVLSKELDLPSNVELELESLLALEVRARSPFLEEDTQYGWRVTGHNKGRLQVCLAIVSRSAVMAYLRQNDIVETSENIEIWALINEAPVVINGFGETERYARYRKRIRWFVAGVIYCLLMLGLLISIPVAVQYLQLQEREEQYESAQQSAAKAVELRSQLTTNNQRAREINDLFASSRDPYPGLEKLTALLGDNIWLSLVNMKGNKVRIEGYASNAAALMQKLSDLPEIEEVTAPSAIRFDNRSKKERFVLELSLKSTGGKK